MIILFDRVVVRIKQLIITLSVILAGGAIKLGLFHLPQVWEDRVTAVALLITLSTRPPVYITRKEN